MAADIIDGPWQRRKARAWQPPTIATLIKGEAFAAPDRSHIHPELDSSFATEIEFAAALVKQLAERAKSLKRIHEQISFSNMQDILETRAAMIRAEIGEHD